MKTLAFTLALALTLTGCADNAEATPQNIRCVQINKDNYLRLGVINQHGQCVPGNLPYQNCLEYWWEKHIAQVPLPNTITLHNGTKCRKLF